MSDPDTKKKRMLDELHALRKRVAELEQSSVALEAGSTGGELVQTALDAFHGLPVGVFVYQYQPPNELFLLNCNAEAELLTGLRLQDRRGEELDEIWPNSRGQGLTGSLLRTMETGTPFSTDRAVFRNGSIERLLRLQAFRLPVDRLGVTIEASSTAEPAAAGCGPKEVSVTPGGGSATPTAAMKRDLGLIKRAGEVLLRAERLTALGEIANVLVTRFVGVLEDIAQGTETGLKHLEADRSGKSKDALRRVLDRANEAITKAQALRELVPTDLPATKTHGQAINLSEAVERGVSTSRLWWHNNPRTQGLGMNIDLQLAPEVLVVADETEIASAVFNLIKNAVETFTTAGNLSIRTAQSEDKATLEVKDNGPGIPRENLARVFDPLWTTKGDRGTGMGLPNSADIVHRYGGEISLQSEIGKGTCATVTLPLARKAVVSTRAQGAIAASGAYRILVVDDLEPIVKMLGEGFKKRGQTVFSAMNGRDAVDAFMATDIDAVICDLAMPGMNGWEVGEAIKRICIQRGIPKIPFIMLTGWVGHTSDAAKIERSGVDRILEKPVDVGRLLQLVHDLKSGGTGQ